MYYLLILGHILIENMRAAILNDGLAMNQTLAPHRTGALDHNFVAVGGRKRERCFKPRRFISLNN